MVKPIQSNTYARSLQVHLGELALKHNRKVTFFCKHRVCSHPALDGNEHWKRDHSLIRHLVASSLSPNLIISAHDSGYCPWLVGKGMIGSDYCDRRWESIDTRFLRLQCLVMVSWLLTRMVSFISTVTLQCLISGVLSLARLWPPSIMMDTTGLAR